jgi:DNA-binding LacI/PurR family transcriptional regulator
VNSSKKALPPEKDFKNTQEILAKTDFDPAIAVERQVAAHVKRLIETGKLAPGARLPPIRTLAALWNTNYFTVQAALRRVFAEGLLVQSPKLGTFVAEGARGFRRVCLYHDHNLSFSTQEEFYSKLNIWLYRILAERGIQITTYFDHREKSQMATAPRDIRELVRERRIDAIIASALSRENADWLTKLGIPYASHIFAPKHGGILLDYEGLAKRAIDEAVRAGKKHIGLIYRPHQRKADKDSQPVWDLRSWIEQAAQAAGLRVTIPEASGKAVSISSFEAAGYYLCELLLAAKDRPDALIIYPDVYTRGVVSALLKHRIEVPRDMLVVSHRNAESSFFAPFPVTWLTVKIEDFALGLIRQVESQIAGNQPDSVIIPVEVESEKGVSVPTNARQRADRTVGE